MAIARFKKFLLLKLLIYTQVIFGQQNSLNNGSPNAQNNKSQVLQYNPSTVATSENYIQNGGSSAGSISAQVPINFQSFIPHTSMPISSTGSLQQPQAHTVDSQPISPKVQILSFQPASRIQPSSQSPETSFVTQSLLPQPTVIPQSQNLQLPQNIYRMPLKVEQVPINAQQPLSPSDCNVQQQMPMANSVQQVQEPYPSISLSNAYVSSYPTSAVSNYPNQRTDFITNYASNYLVPSTSYSITDTPQVTTSYSTSPFITILPTPSKIPLPVTSPTPYSNQISNFNESPLRISNDFLVDNELKAPDHDNLTSLLFALLQSPKQCQEHSTSFGYPGNSYPAIFSNQRSKSSTFKSLLPLLVELISERGKGCCCCKNCQNCDQWNNHIIDNELTLYDGCSNKRDYNRKEEMFDRDISVEDRPRKFKALKKPKTLYNFIPVESCEYDDDYNVFSDEED